MEKLQALLTLHKDKLWGWLYDIQLSNYNSTDIWLWEDVEWDIGNFIRMQSLSDLLFSTPFLSWLEWREKNHKINRSNVEKKSRVTRYFTQEQSDYHKINLALLDTDSERITYIINNTL